MKWTGSAWANADLKRWSGSSFTVNDGYFWNGTSWVLLTDRTPPTSTYNLTYNSVASQNYQHMFEGGGDSKRTDQPNRCYIGYFSADRGMQSSFVLFDWATIQPALDGYVTRYDAKIYAENLHCYFPADGIDLPVAPNGNGTIPNSIGFGYEPQSTTHFNYQQSKLFQVTVEWIYWWAVSVTRGLHFVQVDYSAGNYGYFDYASVSDVQVFFSFEK